MYESFMDEAQVGTLGIKPLDAELARIDALKSTDNIDALIAHNGMIGVDAPFGAYVHQDNKDSTKYVVDFGQSGLGLPDRDYYLKADDANPKQIRGEYQAHTDHMLKLGGVADPTADAALAPAPAHAGHVFSGRAALRLARRPFLARSSACASSPRARPSWTTGVS